MAPRARKRPVVDRLRDARRALETEEGVWRVHRKVCYRCAHSSNPARDTCDRGWVMVKAVTRLRNTVRRLEVAADLESRTQTLW